MAVLGIQIVITMVVASIMSKVGPFFSLARWLLTSSGLIRYEPPTDQELSQLVPVVVKKPTTGGRRHRGPEPAPSAAAVPSFNVPRNLGLHLEKSKVTTSDLVQLRFYAEYQWLLDFSVYALLVYAVSELYSVLFAERAANEVNLSMVWCVLVVGFSYKILCSLSSLYFQGGEEMGGERSLVMVMGLVYMFVAMLILIVHEETLESGLDEAYASFNRSAIIFLEDNAGLDSSGPASKLVLKFFIALWCGSIGALFTFPGLRLARMHWDVLNVASEAESSVAKVLFHASFISPLILSTLWIKPLSRDYLTNRTFKGMEAPILTECQFETLRLYLVVAAILFRLALMPKYLQSYLNVAYYKLEEIKQEAGKITNLELRRMIARVFYYLCVVTLQYITPMVMILFLSLMYKTMGGGSWSGLCTTTSASASPADVAASVSAAAAAAAADSAGVTESLVSSKGVSLAWRSLKQVFTPSVFRGLLGFSTWWCCLSWFVSSAIGMAYQSYFAKV